MVGVALHRVVAVRVLLFYLLGADHLARQGDLTDAVARNWLSVLAATDWPLLLA